MTASRKAQEVLDAQGFIVIASDREHFIGDVIEDIVAIHHGKAVGQLKVVISGNATAEDFARQSGQFFGDLPPVFKGKVMGYYKAVAE